MAFKIISDSFQDIKNKYIEFDLKFIGFFILVIVLARAAIFIDNYLEHQAYHE
jgi:hypothetical protein